MNKFISTILTAIILLIANSCRSQDEDLILNVNNNNEQNLIFKRGNDSIRIDTTNVENKPLEGDPPPKNGHQW